MRMPTLQQWLSEYGESHKNETNKTIHWICVPSIFLSIVGFLYGIKLPLFIGNLHVNVAMISLLMVIAYYISLSRTLWIGMLFFGLICLLICYMVEHYLAMPLWLFSISVFVAAWIGQFYGHKVEGKKPSFFKDVQFLLIGPAWLMHFIYKRLGIPY